MEEFKQTEFVIFDVETTGLSAPQGDRIVEIAALKMRGLQAVDRFHSLINPKREISYEAFLVNGITAQMLEGAPAASHVLPEFVQFLGGACLVGHNVKFDLKFLEHELALIGQALYMGNEVLDTLRLSKRLLPGLRRYSLVSVAHSLALEVTQLHRAMADVELTYEVFRKLLEVADRKDISNFSTLKSL